MKIELTCGLLPLFKRLITKFEVADFQTKCVEVGDLEGYRILECVKQTKNVHYVESFMRHCGMRQREVDWWVKTLPHSFFSRVETSYGK